MLGHVVTLYFRSQPGFEVVDVARSKTPIGPSLIMDITNFEQLSSIYRSYQPNVIINCIGLLNANADNNPADAILANSYLPHFLEKITHDSNCYLIHISTDCVFSGSRGSYSEKDYMDGDGYYARTKALGEIQNNKDITIRTSIIGPELHANGIGLFQWFSSSSGNIGGYENVFWTGVTTIELAKAIHHCIEARISGLYHMVNDQRISKLNLLRIFRNVFTKSAVKEIVPNTDKKYDKSLLNSRTDLAYVVPGYQQMVEEMRVWIDEHRELYPHYIDIL